MSTPRPVVARCEGMFPADLARYEAHRTRKGGDLGHIDASRSHLNRRLIGPADWAERTMTEIEAMRAENYADELEALQRRGRKKEIQKRMVEGPKDPWRASRHGPLREIILTAHKDWFDEIEFDGNRMVFDARETMFEERAVAWLTENFGDDIVHARADRDETTYHIHAVLVPRAAVKVNGATRRMLQPSIHPLIEDYEKLQDSVGAWFSAIGLARGEQRAKAIREAAAKGDPIPATRHHCRPRDWRRQKEAEAIRQRAEVEAREVAAEAEAASLEARRADLVQHEERLAAEDARLGAVATTQREEAGRLGEREEAVVARETVAAERMAEAEAVLAVAEGLGAGAFDIDDAGGTPVLTERPENPSLLARLKRAIAGSDRGRTRAVAALGSAWTRLRMAAGEAAEARLAREHEDLRKADEALVEVAQTLPEPARARIAQARPTIARSLTGIGLTLRRLRGRDGGAQQDGSGGGEK